jgi:ABC-type transport system involved in multi-copper enzyme maturation permease subunit
MSPLVSWPIARTTAFQRVRSAPIAGIGCACLLLALGGGALQGGEATSGLTWFWMHLFAAALSAGLVSEEIESGHAQLVLLRPLTRAAWFGGRLAGALLLALALVALVGAAGAVGAQLGRGHAGALLLFSLPFAWVDLCAWLAVLAALSVVVRGLRNVAAVLLAGLVWFAARTIALQAAPQSPLVARFFDAIQPWLHPHDSRGIAHALADSRPPDWGPLFWNLLWIFAFWVLGVLLLNRTELARRRT